MTTKRLAILVSVGVLMMVSMLAMSALGQDVTEQKAAVQYKVVTVPSVMTQAQLQTVLNNQGREGWRYLGPYAVGSGGLPTQTALIFSKP